MVIFLTFHINCACPMKLVITAAYRLLRHYISGCVGVYGPLIYMRSNPNRDFTQAVSLRDSLRESLFN